MRTSIYTPIFATTLQRHQLCMGSKPKIMLGLCWVTLGKLSMTVDDFHLDVLDFMYLDFIDPPCRYWSLVIGKPIISDWSLANDNH